MSDEKQGSPHAVRHLRPDTRPHEDHVAMPTGPITVLPELTDDDKESIALAHVYTQLQKLREPFDVIEKLPRPMWKGAWEDQRKGKCDECGGYHCLVNTIHLDYIGHAEVTQRLLDVDPMWDWEPVATDEHGLPLLDRFGGMWIYLTICGVTRRGYGDAAGKSPGTTAVKEIIGDAIRNAAMRFGVALDLWSKIDKQKGTSPDDETQNWEARERRGQGDSRSRGASERRERGDDDGAQQTPPRAANQDALDELATACDRNGYSIEYAKDRFAQDNKGKFIRDGSPAEIRRLTRKLITEAESEGARKSEPDGADPQPESGQSEPADSGAPDSGTGSADNQPGPGDEGPAQEPGDADEPIF